jgi:16S rRNA processing protein RimM
MSAPESALPDDAVEVGVVIGAWGIRGALKVKPHATDPQALLASGHWFLRAPEGPAATPPPECCSVVKARVHAEGIVAQLREVPDRTAAEALKGARIFVSRAEFPKTASDEFYWVDLIGLSVVNRQGEALGSVSGLIDTGAHSVLRVALDGEDERLIPFVDAYVDSVDLAARRIVVDWGLDY